jgi:hypothetical protein
MFASVFLTISQIFSICCYVFVFQSFILIENLLFELKTRFLFFKMLTLVLSWLCRLSIHAFLTAHYLLAPAPSFYNSPPGRF